VTPGFVKELIIRRQRRISEGEDAAYATFNVGEAMSGRQQNSGQFETKVTSIPELGNGLGWRRWEDLHVQSLLDSGVAQR
jgi:hypothetical protein